MAKSKKRTNMILDRPFGPEVWRRAQAIAHQYRVLVFQEDGRWHGQGLELPYACGDGATPAEAIDDTLLAFTEAVATMIEQGMQPPAASDAARTEQVNVRLTAEEKLRYETSANQRGFKGLSDFIRAAVVEYVK